MNIKSQKAKNKLGELSFVLHATVSDVDVHKLCDNIEEIVSIAEQEAEDRFLNELKTFLFENEYDPITEATFVEFKIYLEL